MNGLHSLKVAHINRRHLFYTVPMYIVPYYLEESVQTSPKLGGGAAAPTTLSEFKLWKAWVFLVNGGKQVWETEEPCSVKEVVANYLTPNGFLGKVVHSTKTCVYFKIDRAMNLSDLYSWKEFLERAEDIPDVPVLRPVIWVGDKPGVKDDWGWSEQCAEVSLGKYGTLEKLWQGLVSG